MRPLDEAGTHRSYPTSHLGLGAVGILLPSGGGGSQQERFEAPRKLLDNHPKMKLDIAELSKPVVCAAEKYFADRSNSKAEQALKYELNKVAKQVFLEPLSALLMHGCGAQQQVTSPLVSILTKKLSRNGLEDGLFYRCYGQIHRLQSLHLKITWFSRKSFFRLVVGDSCSDEN